MPAAGHSHQRDLATDPRHHAMSGSRRAPASTSGASRTCRSARWRTSPRARARRAGMKGSELELIVFGTCSHDDQVPNMASGIQARLGAEHAGAMDVNTACTSFLYGLSTATAMIRTGVVRNALVIGAELISPFMDWSDRNVAVLFGDGAAAVICRRPIARRRARREARLLRRSARNSARARHGWALHQSRRAERRDALAVRGPGDLQARRARHGRRVRSALGQGRAHRRGQSTSSCRTRRTCASSKRSRSACTCRRNACS